MSAGGGTRCVLLRFVHETRNTSCNTSRSYLSFSSGLLVNQAFTSKEPSHITSNMPVVYHWCAAPARAQCLPPPHALLLQGHIHHRRGCSCNHFQLCQHHASALSSISLHFDHSHVFERGACHPVVFDCFYPFVFDRIHSISLSVLFSSTAT